MLLCRRRQNQLKVFVHQTQWKLRTVIVGRGPPELAHMSRRDDGCLCQDFEQPLSFKTGFLSQDNGLSDGLHTNTQQRIDDQFHSGSRARATQKMELFCDCLENRLSGAEQLPVATYQQCKGAFLGGRSAAGNGDIHYFDANCSTELVQVA